MIDSSVLLRLAEKYETADFLSADPAQFMHRYDRQSEQEIVAFLAANLAFGRRSQILSHVEQILSVMGKSPEEWILDEKYESFFDKGKKSFYRMYTHDSMKIFFATQRKFLLSGGSLGEFFKAQWEKKLESGGKKFLCQLIAENFPSECNLIPHTDSSASKRLNMFLRWMVRDNSPVDMGLWTWFLKKDLLMPLDTHVMQEATKFALIEPGAGGKVRGASMKLCVELTEKMSKVFPGDPVKGDYALFGLGVDGQR
ncbi:MAG: TIGR02757 family protein [Treponema sp.]|nr:TIGR02757 family protein [Treponema sp.]